MQFLFIFFNSKLIECKWQNTDSIWNAYFKYINTLKSLQRGTEVTNTLKFSRKNWNQTNRHTDGQSVLRPTVCGSSLTDGATQGLQWLGSSWDSNQSRAVVSVMCFASFSRVLPAEKIWPLGPVGLLAFILPPIRCWFKPKTPGERNPWPISDIDQSFKYPVETESGGSTGLEGRIWASLPGGRL